MAPQRNHKGQPGPKPTKPPKYECSVCRKELAGDLARHALIHAEPSVKYRFFCPHDGCDRANKPGNKGFPQKCNMLTHLKAVHTRTKHRCPHTYICQGFITECGSLLSDASALSRHRKNFHNYQAGDSPAKVAVPTPCSADHSRTAQCGKYTDRARHTRKRPVEKAFDDRADYLGVAPVAGPSTWSNIKPEPVDFGLLLPSTRTYGVSSAQTTDDVDAVLNQFLSANGLVQFDDSEFAEPPFCELQQDPLLRACDDMLENLGSLPPPHVHNARPTAGVAQVHQGYPAENFYSQQMSMLHPYGPSRESTVSPASSPCADGWAPTDVFNFNTPYRL